MLNIKTLVIAALASITVATKHCTTACTTATPSTTCTTTIYADYVNSCSQWYGGCYPACSGYTTPSFTDAGCPTVTSSSSTLSASPSCDQTICADFVNECSVWYGECYPACSGYPTPSFSKPPCSTTTSMNKMKKHCTKTKCVDYVNDCGVTYGGCFEACRGYKTPTYTDPRCPTLTADSLTPEVPPGCQFGCSDLIDDCNNTYGPGCYTSCPGVPAPTYTTPVCDTDAGTVTTA